MTKQIQLQVPARVHDLTGKRFGKWRVLAYSGMRTKHHAWECRCECGNTAIIYPASNLKSGRSTQCKSCASSTNLALRNTTHGLSKHPLHSVWMGMQNRCHKPKDLNYHRYGGRGIRVCPRWRKSFVAFLTDMGERPPGTEIDREDNDGNYEPGNCRWVTHQQNTWNTGKRRDNTTGYKGVYRVKKNGRFGAMIRAGGKRVHLGFFSSAIAAGRVYRKAARKFRGDFA